MTSQSPEFQVVILGCGAMGNAHARAWSARPDARIAAVYDPDTPRSQALAEAHGAVVCGSPEEAVSTPGVSVVSVCSPVCFHRPLSEVALAHGCHVISEKPIALTDADARAMIACAARHDRQLAVSYQYRTFPGVIRARQLLRDGAIGGPVFARLVDVREVRPKLAMHGRSMNGGPIIDMAGHYFDMMRWLTGAEPTRVYARGHVFGKGKPRLATVTDLAIDAAEILVDYEGGHTLSTFVNWGMPENHPGFGDNRLVGPDGVIRGFPGEVVLERADREERLRLDPMPNGPAGRLADLVGAIRGEHPLEVDGEAGRRALAVCLAALESIETGRAVELPPA